VTANRLALLPMTGAGERECKQCEVFCPFGVCAGDSDTHRDPQCLSAERDAARLRAVEVAARALLDAWEAPYVDAEEELRRCMGPILALRAALKEKQ
jgi:hypothetical protein